MSSYGQPDCDIAKKCRDIFIFNPTGALKNVFNLGI